MYPLELVFLLGLSFNQTFSRNRGPPLNGTFVTSWLYENSVTPSYSYGMHIGSPKLESGSASGRLR